MIKCSGRKLYVIYDFNLVEKNIRGNAAIPLDVKAFAESHCNRLTSQVIVYSLNGPLGEPPDQPFVGPDLSRGATSHAAFAQVDHFEMSPFNQRSAVMSLRFDRGQVNAT
jgi:hypothetical protein